MTGVYEHALGDDASDLHPNVRDRYSLAPDDPQVCVGSGRMDISRGVHVLPLLYAMTTQDMLFPEGGHDVPFSVTTAPVRAGGSEALLTRREFDFGRTRRRFDSLTVWDSVGKRLFDFLGRGGHVVSELHPRVETGALVVEAGDQWLRVGERFVPLSGPLAVDVEVRDRFDPADGRFHVTAVVENALAGHVLSYRGGFTQETEPVESVPAELHPTFEAVLPE